MKFRLFCFCTLSLLLLPSADAKRPKRPKKDKADLSKVASLAMPDLQSVLGTAYQSPLELSDRAMPGAILEVTEFGYRPIMSGCVDLEPTESAFTNITMQSSLSGGVSFGFGGQGASASASQSVGLKFISPYILGFEMVDFEPSAECTEKMVSYNSKYGLSNLVVVQEALFARINGCSEVSASADGKLQSVGGEASASASCQLFSNEPVAVGVRLVSVESFLGSVVSVKSEVSVEASPAASLGPAVVSPSRSVDVVEAQVDGLSGDLATRMAQLEEQRFAMKEAEEARAAEEERQRLELLRLEAEIESARLEAQRPYQEKAKADWARVKVFAETGDDFGKEALSLFISEYSNVRLSISGQTFEVEIPEVLYAQSALNSYRTDGDVGSVEHEGFETVIVSGGTFMMGALPRDGDAYSDEKPRHAVTISHEMEVMTTEVTQGLYASVMGSNPSRFKGEDRPVETVSWFDAVTFANALSDTEGLSSCYRINGRDVVWSDLDCTGWRLPTEAEWEYLARGGEEHKYSGSDDVGAVAWYGSNSGGKTHPVGQKGANGFGLYDMSGNVYEWCWDWYGGYSSGSVTDPRGPSSGARRVVRGGSWRSRALLTRSSRRDRFDPSGSDLILGFRFLRKK